VRSGDAVKVPDASRPRGTFIRNAARGGDLAATLQGVALPVPKPDESPRFPPASADPAMPDPKRPINGRDDPAERRGSERIRARTLADGTIASGGADHGDSFLGSTVDLSLGGACVRTYEALDTGMRVALRFRLPAGDIATVGEVTHVTVDPIGCRMAGIRFDTLPTDERTRLVEHLARIKPAASAALFSILDRDVEIRPAAR
jgi:hypothetical protein